jgi:hypothetical protein
LFFVNALQELAQKKRGGKVVHVHVQQPRTHTRTHTNIATFTTFTTATTAAAALTATSAHPSSHHTFKEEGTAALQCPVASARDTMGLEEGGGSVTET